MAGPRYSEADRRGRTAQRDLTEIGEAGRKTGLRVHARRDDDGFENMSAFFSPTTTAKKASFRRSIVGASGGGGGGSAQSTRSAPRYSIGRNEPGSASASGSYADMEQSSGSEPRTVLSRRQRQSQATAAATSLPNSIRRSGARTMSPTRTHLNSPALRVRSATKGRSAGANGVADTVIARKLDFSRPDSADEDGDADLQQPPSLPTTPTTGRANMRKRKSTEALDPAPASARPRRSLDDEPQYDATADVDDDVQPQTDFGDDGAADDMDDNLGGGGDDEIPLPASPMGGDDLDDEQPATTSGDYDDAGAVDNEVDVEVEAPVKRGRGRPRGSGRARGRGRGRGGAMRVGRPPAAKPAKRRSFSPTAVERQRARSGSRGASPQREWRETVEHSDANSDDSDPGTRRGKRLRVKPLAFWRGEKLVYGRGGRRRSIGGTLGLSLPEVKEIIHVDVEEDKPKRRYNRKQPGAKPGRRRVKHEDDSYDDDRQQDPAADPEDDFEAEEVVSAEVHSLDEPEVRDRQTIAYPLTAYSPRAVVDQGIFFQRTLKDKDFFAAGLLDLPPGAAKTRRSSKRNLMFFCVYQGYVEVDVSENVFRLRRGAQFMVPRGNDYEIRNVGANNARLFFSQVTDTLYNYTIDAQAQAQAEAEAEQAAVSED